MTHIVHKIIDKTGITKKIDSQIEYFTYMLLWYAFFVNVPHLV